jgi:hypothetical protein
VIAKRLRAQSTLDPATQRSHLKLATIEGTRTPSGLRSKIRDQMSLAAVRPATDLLRRVVRLQMLTIVWMSIEAVVATFSRTSPPSAFTRTLAQFRVANDSEVIA